MLKAFELNLPKREKIGVKSDLTPNFEFRWNYPRQSAVPIQAGGNHSQKL